MRALLKSDMVLFNQANIHCHEEFFKPPGVPKNSLEGVVPEL